MKYICSYLGTNGGYFVKHFRFLLNSIEEEWNFHFLWHLQFWYLTFGLLTTCTTLYILSFKGKTAISSPLRKEIQHLGKPGRKIGSPCLCLRDQNILVFPVQVHLSRFVAMVTWGQVHIVNNWCWKNLHLKDKILVFLFSNPGRKRSPVCLLSALDNINKLYF